MAQGVIQRSDTYLYLRRKYSYARHSWTTNLQDAQVFSMDGINQAVRALTGRWDEKIDGKKPEFVVMPVSIVRL